MSDSKHKLFIDYIYLITQHFDNRVFIQNIFLRKGKVELSHYSYQVEFQARRLLHSHRVSWIAKQELFNRVLPRDLITNSGDAALNLIDELVTWKIPEDNIQLKKIVMEVQQHKHTKSCMKYRGKSGTDFQNYLQQRP